MVEEWRWRPKIGSGGGGAVCVAVATTRHSNGGSCGGPLWRRSFAVGFRQQVEEGEGWRRGRG